MVALLEQPSGQQSQIAIRRWSSIEGNKQKSALAGRQPSVEDLYGAIMKGAVERVRPKMMTVVAIMAIYALVKEWQLRRGSE